MQNFRGSIMTPTEQMIENIYNAMDQFETETGILISSITQDYEVRNGIPVLLDREIKFSHKSKAIY